MPAFLQFLMLIVITFVLHESMHFGVAKLFGFSPQRFFNVKNWRRSNSVYSMTFNCPIGTPIWKIFLVLISGPLVEISFIVAAVYYENFLLFFVNICSLIGSYYDFDRIFNLFKYKKHYQSFGYFGV